MTWDKRPKKSTSRLPVFTYEAIMERIKFRMRIFLEERRRRLLIRLGISSGPRVKAYSNEGGGIEAEVS
jgi:hypothetical protein